MSSHENAPLVTSLKSPGNNPMRAALAMRPVA